MKQLKVYDPLRDFKENPMELGSAIKKILKKVILDLGAKRASLMVIDEEKKEFYIKASSSIDPKEELSKDIIKATRIKLGESIAGIVAKTKKPVIINDVEKFLSKYPVILKTTDPKRYKTSIIVPIIENGKTKAIININDKVGHPRNRSIKFVKSDLALAIILAEYCGVALTLERKNMELLAINEIISEINETNDLSKIYKVIIEKGAEILNCEEVSVMIVESEDKVDKLVVRESTDKSIIGEKREIGIGVSGWVWKTGEPILIKSVKEGKKDKRFKILNKPGSFIVAPLNLKMYKSPYALNVALKSRDTIGVLNLTNRLTGEVYSEEDLNTIVSYANLCAIAIEKAKFYNQTKEAYIGTVTALAAAVESKDKYTRNHLADVVKYSLLLGEKLGLSGIELEELHVSALLHDIGKIGIEDHILNKPGKLTPSEYERVKLHIEEGDKILKHVPYFDKIRELVRCHHEHYNGGGYPDKLKGESIPLGARILSITDAYDVMTTDRVYRKQLSHKEAVDELKKYAGMQFDPKLVDIFLEIVEKEYK